MCPACIATATGMVVGAGSAGGILAVFLDYIKRTFRARDLRPLQETKEDQIGNN